MRRIMAAALACPLCLHQGFSHPNQLIQLMLDFLQRPLSCPICGCQASNVSELSKHLVQHSLAFQQQALQFHCKQNGCLFSSTDLAALRLHVESEHPERKYLCVHCCKLFKAQASLTLHLRMAHGSVSSPSSSGGQDPRHQCQFCDKKFASLARKQAHEKSHPSPPSSQLDPQSPPLPLVSPVMAETEENAAKVSILSCPVCEKTFKKEQYLQQHIRTHEAKKYECSVCRKLFTTKEYLRKHARLHTGETPYTCDQCGKTFTFQQSYHKHLLYHSDERPYSCDQCNRRFKELSTLHNHQRIHTGEKPYSCDICGKAFRQRVSYVVHRRIHTGALPYVCTACGKSFRYKVSQRTHKCEASRNDADGSAIIGLETKDIIRPRPVWLERLVTAQQLLTSANVQQEPLSPEFVQLTDNNLTGNTATPLSVSECNEEGKSDPSSSTFDPKSYYDSDSLPTIDLSQLTLSLDSDLIFPS